MRFHYDKEVDAGYTYLKYPIRQGESKKIVTLNDNIILDFDRKNKLIGIEILNASKVISKESLKRVAKSI